MDNTLDSIRPSFAHPQEEMSYLFGRDPSILAYGQRPCPSKDTKKNLLSVYEIEECNSIDENSSINSDSPSFQTVKVYLRLKPFPKKLNLSHDQQEAYTITNSTTLFTRLPALDNNTSCLKRSNASDMVCRKYMFTKTFGPETTQLELFEQAVKQQMIDFIAGQNSTIMTYGTTNSGKSYTLQGTTTSPGIIPRGLEFVFSNITPKSIPSYKPLHHCDVVSLDPIERAQELEIKSKLLTFASVDKHQYINAYKEMQKLLQEESPIRPSQCNGDHYSVWVSFAEIYNETVYDLLSNECQKKRTALKLATDSQGRAFIKGLKTVCVNSGSEAYQVLMAGQYNLKVAATALNARSSRSHCIFTIKLLKYYAENKPESVEVSTFAFCDLAGSERLKKTLNIGDRLKEAQNINTSLLVLGRCLKSIHEGQLAKQKIEHIGPFRESKLTRLFQKALSGKEHIALIVNINPLPNLYVETQNVLSFSAIAKKIVIEPKEKAQKKSKSRFSQMVTQSIKTVTDWDAAELESEEWQNTAEIDDATSEYVQAEDYEDVVAENERLKKEIAILKSTALTRDLQIRQEMADTYSVMMKELEARWKNRIKDVEEQQADALEWSVKQVEDFYKQKLDQLSSRKRRRSSSNDSIDDDLKNIEELEIQNSRLTSRVVTLKNSVKELRETNEVLNVEKNKVTFELGLMKEDLNSVKNLLNAAQKDICSDEDTKLYVEELKAQLFAKQEQVKKLKVFLNEAKEEYIVITTEVREKEYLLKEQEELLVENEDKIEDLEGQLEQTNICLTEKTKAVETLEEKLESQSKKLMDSEEKLKEMLEQISELENEKQILLDEVELLRKTKSSVDVEAEHTPYKTEKLEKSVDSSKDDAYQEIIVKEEVSSILDPEILNKSEDGIFDRSQAGDKNKLDATIEEKLTSVESENSALKNRLAQSTTEIQSLKEELEFAKTKLKDISDQIHNLKTNNSTPVPINNANGNDSPPVKELVEAGCQVEIECKDADTVPDTTCVENKSSQTIEKVMTESTNQTSFIEESSEDDVVDEWAKLSIKYDDIKKQYKEKCMRVEELNEEILSLKERIDRLAEENGTSKVIIEEYKQSVELLQKEVSTIKDTRDIEEVLRESDTIKITLEKQISEYKDRLDEKEKELAIAKDEHSCCMQQLKEVQEDFDKRASKCKQEHDQTLCELQKELSIAKEKSDIKSQCLDVHAAKISELEQSLESVTELQQRINELSHSLESCQIEKERLQSLFDENNERLLELEDRLEQAEDKEREKDAEIASLQQEMKRMIQRQDTEERDGKIMEREMKTTIRELTETKNTLSMKEEQIEHLEMRIKSYEQNAKVLDLLQQSAQERQAENERLRNINDELKNSIIQKEREMETFMKHRDDMVTKYETLVKKLQDDLEKQKREFSKNETHRREKDYCENTSEDEVILKERRGRRPARKVLSPPKPDEIAVIDLSGSDSKRNGKRTVLPPPSADTLSERKRNTRKKKLFIPENESFQDIEPLESTVTITPTSQARSLRSRRK